MTNISQASKDRGGGKRPAQGYARGEAARLHIIETAVEVFGVHGFEDASTREISVNAQLAAQGNATRLFFRHEIPGWPAGWIVVQAGAFSSFSYLLSGGYSEPALYPARCLEFVQRVDQLLSRFPRLFGARCLVVLEGD